MSAEDLAGLRRAIDELDDTLVRLLDERAALAGRIGELKRARGAPFYVPEREREILERLTRGSGVFPREALRAVLREIISACLSLERPLRVGYLGPEASLAHAACRRRFGLSARLVPAATAAAVLADVVAGVTDLGVMPVESSAEGSFGTTLDALAASPLAIVGEIALASGLALLTRSGSLSTITRVFGTSSALQAGRGFVAQHLTGVSLTELPSAALAGLRAAADDGAAAVASRSVALLYELEVAATLDPGEASVTRALVIGREAPARTGRDRTSLLVGVRNEPAGLHRVLAPFAERGVNLLQIDARPLPFGAPFDYRFFLDLEGHTDDEPLRGALESLRSFAAEVRVLGSYGREEPGPRDSLP